MNESPPTACHEVPRPVVGFELRQASTSDVHRLKATLAEAFCDDPIFGWLMPDEQSRRVGDSPPLRLMVRPPAPAAGGA